MARRLLTPVPAPPDPGPIRARLLEGRAQWSPHRLLRANLECILGRELPARATLPAEDVSGDCGICYSYRLPSGEVPERGAKPSPS